MSNLQIDNGPRFPNGYSDELEYRNGITFCCCTIPTLISLMFCGAACYLVFGLLNLYLFITLLIKIGNGDDVELWTPGGGFISKYAEAQQNDQIETHGSMTAYVVIFVMVEVFVIVCRGFICYYLYPIAVKNSRFLKDRKQAVKAPIIYIAMDVLSIIVEVIGGLIILNLYGDEYKTEYLGRDG